MPGAYDDFVNTTPAYQPLSLPIPPAKKAGAYDDFVSDPTPEQPMEEPRGLAPLTFFDRVKRGAKDIGQGVYQRGLQATEALYGPTANSDQAITRYPDTGGSQPPQPEVTHIHGQSAADYTAGVNKDLQDYTTRANAQGAGVNVPFLGKTDFPRLLGSAAATAPLALVPGGEGVMGAIGSGAMTGGATGLAQFDPSNSAAGVLKNTAAGAVSGAVLNPAIHGIGNLASKAASGLVDRWKGMEAMTPTVDDVSKLPGFEQLPIDQQGNVLKDAQAQMAQRGSIDTESLARKSNLMAHGLTPTEGMVTRDAGTWANERNMAKTMQQSANPAIQAQGRRLNNVFVQNDQRLSDGLRGMSTDLPPGNHETYGQTAMTVVNDIQKDSQAQVGQLYKQIRDTVGDNVGARPNAILDTINELSTSPAADPIVDATHRWMIKKGILTKAADGSYQPDGTLSITQAEALRQHINSQPNSFGKAQLIRGVDKDVLDTAGSDQFGQARDAAKERFQALDNPAVQRVLNTYGELQQGRTAQNFIQQHVLSAPMQDVHSLVGTVMKYGTPEQQDTFRSALQAGVMKHLEDKSINQTTGQFSGTALDKNMKEIGDARMIEFMDPDRMEKLQNLRQAAVDSTVQPPHSAVNHSNSGAALLGLGNERLLGPGFKAFLPDIAHEVLPSAISNAPQNAAVKSAVNNTLAARGLPPPTPPNPLIKQLSRMLSMGAVPAIANQVAQPKKPAPQQP